MKFCPHCATALEERVPPGDDRLRKVCPACGSVHYQNPRTVVGCIVEHEGGVLLCRRAIEPAQGLWTPPAGFLELGESTVEGAVRETYEEARARAEVVAPHAFFDLPHIGQTYVLYRARLCAPGWAPGPESQEVSLFPLDELPWEALAFPVLHFALRQLVDDESRGERHLHLGVVRWSGEGSRFDPANYDLADHRRVRLAREGR